MEKRAKGGGNVILYTQVIETEGDKRLFEEVYTAYCGRMLALARQKLSSAADAEDAVHQAFLSILKHLNKISLSERQKTQAFVVIIVERKAIDMLRARIRSDETIFLEEISGIPAPEKLGLEEAIALLPEHYRNILTMKYVIGFTTTELADMMGLTVSGVSKQLFRAKEALKEILRKDGITL